MRVVSDGRVREFDRLDNTATDEAADFGRRSVGLAVIDARRNLSGAVVNHVGFGGTAPDPMIWSAGSLLKRRSFVHAVRNFAMFLGLPALWLGKWVLLLMRMMLLSGPTLLVFWSSGFLFLVLCACSWWGSWCGWYSFCSAAHSV